MQKYKTLSDAIALAEFAHRNQVDKAGLPYIEHPKRVLAKVQAQGAMPYVQIAAILHDVSEDTAFSSDILLSLGFSEAAVRIVRLLDRGYSEERFKDTLARGQFMKGDYHSHKNDFYYNQISFDAGAKMVKLADIEDNLSPWRLAYLEPDTQKRLRIKYDKALSILVPRL